MCFGIRIASSFHLGTFQIPIQYLKCPTDAKNASPDTTLLPSESPVYSKWKHLACFEEEIIELSFHFQLWSHITVQCITTHNLMWFMHSSVGQHRLDLDCWCKDGSSSFTLDGWGESNDQACIFSILGHFRVWMGICNVPRWNELKILIPEHMWKS